MQYGTDDSTEKRIRKKKTRYRLNLILSAQNTPAGLFIESRTTPRCSFLNPQFQLATRAVKLITHVGKITSKIANPDL